MAPDALWRRYSEFELLRNYLLVTYPFIVVPPLPEKRVSVRLECDTGMGLQAEKQRVNHHDKLKVSVCLFLASMLFKDCETKVVNIQN